MWRNGDGGYAEFGSFLPQEFADVGDGRLGEALVEFLFGGDILARRGGGASGWRHHADGVRALDGHHLGPGFQQDVAYLPAHLLVAPLCVTLCSLPVLGDSVAPSLTVAGLAGDVALVFPLPVPTPCTALMVGEMS